MASATARWTRSTPGTWSRSKPHGHLVALDGATGKLVWDQVFVDVRAAESATMAPLVVKNLVIVGSVGGKQYVAVLSGWGGWMKGYAPELYGAPRGDALIVFALP